MEISCFFNENYEKTQIYFMHSIGLKTNWVSHKFVNISTSPQKGNKFVANRIQINRPFPSFFCIFGNLTNLCDNLYMTINNKFVLKL